jgi:hypothetical protein
VKNVSAWYLLFEGSSQDGRGIGTYCGRTTDQDVARKHYEKLVLNQLSIGRVEIVTDERMVGSARGRMTFDAAVRAAGVSIGIGLAGGSNGMKAVLSTIGESSPTRRPAAMPKSGKGS